MRLVLILGTLLTTIAFTFAARSPTPDDKMFTLECSAPARQPTCKKDCTCEGNRERPDCSQPICYDNCRCRCM